MSVNRRSCYLAAPIDDDDIDDGNNEHHDNEAFTYSRVLN